MPTRFSSQGLIGPNADVGIPCWACCSAGSVESIVAAASKRWVTRLQVNSVPKKHKAKRHQSWQHCSQVIFWICMSTVIKVDNYSVVVERENSSI